MFITIDGTNYSELIEKKSKFIANIFYAETRAEAEEKIKEMKKKYHDARHNCSAYIVWENDFLIEKSSDDGEPSGTAGAPMLNILKRNNLCNIVVIVTRYFGGILLGTGGLVRAYSDVTLDVINKSKKQEICLGKEYRVKIQYNNLESLKYYCKKNNINVIKINYLDDVECILEIENNNVAVFLEDIKKRKINITDYKEICERHIRKKVKEN